MPRREIDQGNADAVLKHGRHVTLVPPEADVGNTRRLSRVIRGQGLDVINGGERANPTGILVTDDAYPGWRVAGTIAGEEIAVANNLPAGWTDAWLIIYATFTLTGYATFDVTVTQARLESASEYPNQYPVWKNNPGDGSLTTPDGVYSFPVATTSNGQRRMVNFHQRQFWWDEYGTPQYAKERYYESISDTGLNDCGLGYTIYAQSVVAGTSNGDFCYMDSVSSPYSGDDLFLAVKTSY